MLDFLKNTVIKPGLERLGSITAVWLVAQGDTLCALYNACGVITPTIADHIVTGVSVGILVGVDLVIIQMNRKNQK